ncbi:hypothetical protein GCM10009682_23420 [Luedemannella flava]|uniref:Cytochrome c-type biogenesis protein n=1 Tax=Luedemannella flava TaxID=349316 RepID=A0ABP4Y1V0_9ACTN
MKRRLVGFTGSLVLAAGAAAAVWRSVPPDQPSARDLAAQLVCPACQGETVAQSASPMAAAMRATIAQQLATGHTGQQIRQYFVDRYGAGILADPAAGGLGAVLWVVPVLVLAALAVLVWRSRRRPADPGPLAATGPARTWRRAWDVLAVAVVALVAAVAVASPREPGGPAAATAADPTVITLAVGRSLEEQGRYAEAADVYRDALDQQPDDRLRRRLAFALLRAGRLVEAEAVAARVLDDDPGDPDALLLLGLAQRASGSPKAAATLRRFLRQAPDHPAAAEVRRLLGDR